MSHASKTTEKIYHIPVMTLSFRTDRSTQRVSTLVNFLNYWVWYPPLFHLIGYVTHPFFFLKFALGILHFELRKLERKTYMITFNHGPSCTFGSECEVANYIVYDRRSKVKPWLDSKVYQLIHIFGSVEHRTAQAACNFVYLFLKNSIYFEDAIFHSPTGSALLCIQPIIVADRWRYHP